MKKEVMKNFDKFKLCLLTYCHKIKAFFVSFMYNWFDIFSLIYLIFTIILIVISCLRNYFDLIDMSNFFLTIWWMLWSILALCVTIHIFYVQSFLNYSTLTFIYDVSKSKKNYLILWSVWIFTLIFFFLWWNFNIIINKCPDYFLFPTSLFLVSLSIWLVIYYFYDITKRLSPYSLCEDTEKYFKKTVDSLKNYEKLRESYFRSLQKYGNKWDLWIDKFIKKWKKFKIIGWYKLESLCDNYLKLLDKRENRLASEFLTCIENCFWYLIQSYGIIKTDVELKYLTDTTEIDHDINKFFDRIEWIILLNIKNKDIELIWQSFRLCLNIIVHTYDISYTSNTWKIKKEKTVFLNLIHRWNKILRDIIKYNNEEAFFQRKEWTKKIISMMIDGLLVDYSMIFRIESVLNTVNLINMVLTDNQKSFFNLYEIYSLIYLSIIDNKLKDRRNVDILNKSLYEFMGNNKNNIDEFIQSIRFSLSMGSDFLIFNTENDKNYIKNMLLFIDTIHDIISFISQKEWLEIWNRVWLLIQQLWLYFFNVKDIEWMDKSLIRQWLNRIIDIVNVIINSKNKVFSKNVMLEEKVYDQLCWIWIYAKKEDDRELFEKCFKIFEKHILNFSCGIYWLWEIKYFCYWLFIEEEDNYNKYFNILHQFFELELKKYGEEHIDYWKREIIGLINKVNWCFDMEEWDMDSQLSKILLKGEEWVSIENQEKVTKKLLLYCSDILSSKKK